MKTRRTEPAAPAGSDLPALSATALRDLIASGDISPAELLEACIERIEKLNPAINAIAATCFARTRAEARQAERRVRAGEATRPLHGLPIGIKDLQETAGLLTTYGSPRFRDFVPEADHPLVAALRRDGAIVVAKTNVPEMGAGANTRNQVWGATGNPFDPNLNAGGSSGGSAAALALDMLPLGTGSDTGGSLRIPAALCGVVGFRPSPGLVPNGRRPVGWSPISVLGPMARSVDDVGLLLQSCIGLDENDPLSYPTNPEGFASAGPIDLGSLRVGYTEDFGVCHVDAAIRAVFRQRIDAIRHLFGDCRPVDFALGDADRCFDIVRAESFVAAFRETYERDPALLGPLVRANYEAAAGVTLADRAWAHAEQTRLFRNFQETMAGLDLVLAPTTPLSPFPWTEPYASEVDGHRMNNYYHWLALTYVVTLATNPALALPCGVDHRGMPFGLQVVGRFRGDAALLAAAREMERAFAADTATRRPRPDGAALPAASPALRSIVTDPPVTAPRNAAGGATNAV